VFGDDTQAREATALSEGKNKFAEIYAVPDRQFPAGSMPACSATRSMSSRLLISVPYWYVTGGQVYYSNEYI
jgi:hypothetical protein